MSQSPLENLSPQKKRQYELLKMELHAILVSADAGITPEDLNRDYQDINGRSIPYRDFEFLSYYKFLDTLSDIMEAYNVKGKVLLFYKSSNATRHMETLINKQRKQDRVGRFGGVVNIPAQESHGTLERQTLIAKRVDRLLKNRRGPMKSVEILRAYEWEYGEPIDIHRDFKVPNIRYLFEVKWAKYFEVIDEGSGAYSIGLKQDTDQVLAAAENSTKRPYTPPPPRPPTPVNMENQQRPVQQFQTRYPLATSTPFNLTPEPGSPIPSSTSSKPAQQSFNAAPASTKLTPVAFVASKMSPSVTDQRPASFPSGLSSKLRPDADLSGNARRRSIEETAKDEREIPLMELLWKIFTKRSPGKPVRLHDIPALYEEATGKSFPRVDLDDFAFELFDQIDLFSFGYEKDGELLIIPEPDGCM